MSNRFDGRRRTRLAGYDYRLANAYFVTFTTHASAQLFGTVTVDGVVFSDAGDMVDQHLFTLSNRFPRVVLHEWIVMPDHVHLLLALTPNDSTSETGESLSDVIQWLKTMTTNAYIRGVKERGWAPFDGKVWHTSFHDRIVRDDAEFETIRRYIQLNPARRWARLCADGAG
jgi:REP element-mobilizing transposase RayT